MSSLLLIGVAQQKQGDDLAFSRFEVRMLNAKPESLSEADLRLAEEGLARCFSHLIAPHIVEYRVLER